MSNTNPQASADAPYLATSPDAIERLLSTSATPLDTVCGLLATDPALLTHLLRRVAAEGKQTAEQSLRQLARRWLEASDHAWYSSLVTVSHSALSDEQKREHQKLCSRAAIGAALIGEWGSQNIVSLREGADKAEIQAVIAVLPSLLRLCRCADGSAYASVEEEGSAWLTEATQVLGDSWAKSYQAPSESTYPGNIAVEIASVAVRDDAEEALQQKMPEWSRRLGRDVSDLQADLKRVELGLQKLDKAHDALKPEYIRSLIRGESAVRKKELDCDGCRQQAYDNALSTVRTRLTEGGMGLVELVDHLMHAVCNCGTLRRAHWYSLDGSRQFLQSRRRKTALRASELDASDLAITELPMMQVLLERPRSIQVFPEIRQQLAELLPQSVDDPFEQHYLCASVFCGTVPLGVFYADASGQQIGASEAAKFKAVAQLATKMATLLALRNHRQVAAPDTSQLAYPDYASFVPVAAANEVNITEQDEAVIRQSNSL